MIVPDNREAVKRSIKPTCDQGLFLCGQMCYFLHRILRKMEPRTCSWDANFWDRLRFFDFSLGECLVLCRRLSSERSHWHLQDQRLTWSVDAKIKRTQLQLQWRWWGIDSTFLLTQVGNIFDVRKGVVETPYLQIWLNRCSGIFRLCSAVQVAQGSNCRFLSAHLSNLQFGGLVGTRVTKSPHGWR